jgi:hypothetical protein
MDEIVVFSPFVCYQLCSIQWCAVTELIGLAHLFNEKPEIWALPTHSVPTPLRLSSHYAYFLH